MLEWLFRLLDYMVWADAQIEDAVRVPEAPEPARTLYAHVVGAGHEWLARIEGRSNPLAIWPEIDQETCARAARDLQAGYRALLDTLQEPDLERRIAYTNSAGTAFATPLGDILLHVFLHGSYHRGQIAQLLKGAGAGTPPTDYILFTRR